MFDKSCQLILWLDEDYENLFDLNLNWIAFNDSGNVFSSRDLRWLGVLEGTTLLDTKGKPVFWSDPGEVASSLTPMKPLKPLMPLRPLRPLKPLNPLKPLRPLTPLGGWSSLSYKEWLGE